jgi:hypothetical protein
MSRKRLAQAPSKEKPKAPTPRSMPDRLGEILAWVKYMDAIAALLHIVSEKDGMDVEGLEEHRKQVEVLVDLLNEHSEKVWGLTEKAFKAATPAPAAAKAA